MMRRTMAIVGVTAVVLAGCGGDGEGDADTTASPDTTPETQTTADADSADTVDGSTVFSANCSSCHGATGTGGNVGPSLTSSTDPNAVERQVREGGGGMPAFEGSLSDEEIEAVTEHVTQEIAGS